MRILDADKTLRWPNEMQKQVKCCLFTILQLLGYTLVKSFEIYKKANAKKFCFSSF